MWQELLLAFGLLLVIEGILPAINPQAFRRALLMLSGTDDRVLRNTGLVSMVLGAAIIFLIR